MEISRYMMVNILEFNLVMEIWQPSNNKEPVEDNNIIQPPESTFGNLNQSAFPGSNQVPGMGQQSFGSQPGQSSPANQRWRSPQQNQPSYGQDQMPFPNNGHSGQ